MELDTKLYDIRHVLVSIQIILTLGAVYLLLVLSSIAHSLQCIRTSFKNREDRGC